MKVYTATGKALTLVEPPMAQGGEGAIYAIDGYPTRVAKVYLRAEDADGRRAKIEAMCSISAKFSSSGPLGDVAWPLGALYADKRARKFVGFGMRRITSPINVDALYEYPPLPGANFSMADKLEVAESIARVTKAVHEAGQVVGDYNDNNIRVLPHNQVALVDVDSFHVTIGGKTYRCPVCMAGYVAPEVLRAMHGCKSYETCPRETFTEKTDDWALAVHLFRILFNGAHPYHCLPLPDSSGSVPAPMPVDKRVERGETPFFKKVPGVKVPPFAPDVDMLPSYLKSLFKRAFVDGHTNPEKRPSAAEWERAMASYRHEVRQTCRNEAHWHATGGKCPYCKADERTGLSRMPRNSVVSAPTAAAATAQTAASTTPTTAASATAKWVAPASFNVMDSVDYWLVTMGIALVIGLLFAFVTPLGSLLYTELFDSYDMWMQVLTVVSAVLTTGIYNLGWGADSRKNTNCALAALWAAIGIAGFTGTAFLLSLVASLLWSLVSSVWFWVIVIFVVIALFN